MLDYLKKLIGFHPLRWRKNTRRMLDLVSDPGAAVKAEKADPLSCGVLITPWLGTSVPWFAMGVGLQLALRGNRVTFLLDDYMVGGNSLRYRFVLRSLKTVLSALSVRHQVVTLSRVQTSLVLNEEMRKRAEELARLNAVWELRGEMLERGRAAFEAKCNRQLQAAMPAIHSVVQPGAFDLLFMPGGVWGTTGIWSDCARAAGIRIGSFDAGGYGTVMLAANGIACQLQDIPAAFSRIKDDKDSVAKAFAVREAQAEMDRRRKGVDPFMSQVQGSDGGDSRYDGAVLLALNSSWDSAALGLHAVFDDNTDWIVRTVRYLLDTTDVPVIVRQHPAERLAIGHTTDDYRALLDRHFGKHPRLHFIAAADKINSYDLMRRIRAMVVYTSTIGIEAAANGKPVVTASNSYYSGLGFVYKASTLAAYQDLLRRAAGDDLSISLENKQDAMLCYYLTQCCNWVFSSFNPADFDEWSVRSLPDWAEDAAVLKMMDALERNIPIAYLNHLDRMGSAQYQ